MAVRPIEEHPCLLRGKGTQIKYATELLRALFHAKPNISPDFSIGKSMLSHLMGLTPSSQLAEQFGTIARTSLLKKTKLVNNLSSDFAFGSLRDELFIL